MRAFPLSFLLPVPLRSLFLSVLLLGLAGRAWAQGPAPADTTAPARDPVAFGLATQHSFIIAHTPKVAQLAQSHPSGLEARVEWQTTGRAPWHRAWRLPRVGVAVVYYDYHNPVLAHSIAVSTFASKFIYRSPRQQVHFITGIGLAWFTNPFSLADNRRNTIVSTHLNAAINFRFDYHLRLAEHLDAQAAVGLQHYSNGATSKPNFGINLPTLAAGLVYRPTRWVPPPAARHLAPLPPDQRRWFVDLATSVGWRQWGVYDRKRYLVNGIHAQVGRRVNIKNNLVAGLEYFYDRSLLTQRVQDTTVAGGPDVDVRKVGVVVGQELLLGALALDWHFGWYLYAPYKSATPYYERIGLKYLITRNVFGAVDLKVHRGAADVIEWKLGVRL